MIELDATVVGPWVCMRTQGTWSAADAIAIGWRDSTGTLVSGVIVDHWNGASCALHVATDKPLAREFTRFCFRYVFNQLKAKKIIGLVAASNTRALRLDKHLGFIEEHRIEQGHPDGDLVILSLIPEHCTWR